jgi:predicted Zn-dependent protease with MMP-like domain
MSMDEFCSLVERVVSELPAEIQDLLDNVVVDIESAPADEVLEDTESASPDDLLGLFVGVGVDEQEYGVHTPNRVILYKRSIERVCRSRAEIAYEIRRTVLHELAHHFGYSEDDLEDFESQPSPFDDPDG